MLPMARPVNADTEATRARIRAAAMDLLAERMTGDLSIREVSRRADVSVSLVNHYFDSKEGLLEACIDTMYLELESARDQALAQAMEFADAYAFIEATVRAGFAFACEHRPIMRALVGLVLHNGELPETGRNRIQVPFLDQWSAQIASLLGCTKHEARLTLQSIAFLTSRYSIATAKELVPIVGLGEGVPPERLREQVADHLATASRALLRSLDRRV